MILSTDQAPATTTPDPAAVGTPPAQPPVVPDTPAPASTTEPTAPEPAVTLEEPKPEVQPDPDTSQEFVYDPTGDASLDIALGYIGKLGYSPQHPAIIAAQAGDFSLIRAELAINGVKGGAEMLAVAEDGYKRLSEKQKEKDSETRSYGEKACDGAANFNAVLEWGKANLDASAKAWFNASVAQGGIAAQAAIDKLAQSYLSANKFSKTPGNPAPGAGAATSFSESGPIDAATFKDETAKIRAAAAGRNYETSDQYQALKARRLAGIRAGLN